jgi:hypothetical protein
MELITPPEIYNGYTPNANAYNRIYTLLSSGLNSNYAISAHSATSIYNINTGNVTASDF